MRRGRVAWGRAVCAGLTGAACLALANCSSSPTMFGNLDPRYGVSSSPRVIAPGEPVPKGGGSYRVGAPYVVGGRTYVPVEDPNYRAEGLASWYGEDFHGRLTANGEIFDMHAISAAHPTLPMPCYARVTNLANGRSLVVRVNDRGPYAGNREIDLSVRAAELLGFYDRGLARVRVEYVGAAPLQGTDDRQLMATLRDGEPAPIPGGVTLASARPYVPDPSYRGSVPVPADRPFDLGERATMESAAPAADRLSQAHASPVAAFAPARLDTPSPLTTGRGLY
jgi:rare lipoprotein A